MCTDMSILRYFLFFFLLFSMRLSTSHDSLVFDCTQSCEELVGTAPESLYIHSCAWTANTHLDSQEMRYLMSIKDKSSITSKDLESAAFYLRQKNCFEKIILTLIPHDDGYDLLCDLTIADIFVDLSFKGVLYGKDKLRQLYILEPGDRFDEQKHATSLERIKQFYIDLGYLKVQLKPHVHTKHNKVTVKLEIKKGPNFSIRSSSVRCKDSQNVYEDDAQLAHMTKKLFKSKVFASSYSLKNLDRAQEMLKKRLEAQGFAHIDIKTTGVVDAQEHVVDVVFDVQFHKKKKFVFFGNHFFDRTQLLETVLSYGKSSWHFPATILEDEIKQLYAKKGFWKTSVKVTEEPERVFCVIEEGARAQIKEIFCKDNAQLTTDEIIKIFKNKLPKKYVDQEKIDAIFDYIQKLYAQRGYWNAKIVKKEYVLIRDQHYMLTLIFDEGEVKKLEKVEVIDYPQIFKKSPFEYLMNPVQPVIFNQELIQEIRQWLIAWFKQQGNIRISVAYEIEQGEFAQILRWKIVLDDASAIFGKTVQQGYSTTPFYYLEKELSYKEHEQWKSKKVQKTINNIREIGVYDTIEMHPLQELDPYGHVPVALRVIQSPTYEIRTRVGVEQVGRDFTFAEGFSYKAGGTFIVNNPLNMADQLSMNADFTRFYRNASLKYSMPWIGHAFKRSNVRLYDNYYNQPLYVGSKKTLYISTQKGCMFSLQDNYLGFDVALSAGVDVMGIKTGDVKNVEKALDYEPSLMNHKQLYFVIEPTLMWDTLDNILLPRMGHRSFLALKTMLDVQGKSSFLKFTAEHAYYTPFVKNTILAVRLRLGHIFNSTLQKIHPIERFYLGGANSMRGYERDYCPPLGALDEPIAVDSGALPDAAGGLWRYVPQGGKTMINANAEIRFPIFKAFDGVIFTDLGGLFKERTANITDGLLASSGFGVRYNTPIGPLRFDIGWKWKRQYPDFESAFGWYLTFGHSF